MTFHQLLVIGTGAIFLGAGVVLSQVFRLLGPTFYTKRTAHWSVRGFFFGAALVLVARGLSFIWPGDWVKVQQMSALVPLSALATLGCALFLLEWVMRDRAPPPWSARLLGFMAREGASDETLLDAAMTLPPEPHGKAATEAQPCRCVRIAALVGAGALITGITAIVLLNAAGG